MTGVDHLHRYATKTLGIGDAVANDTSMERISLQVVIAVLQINGKDLCLLHIVKTIVNIFNVTYVKVGTANLPWDVLNF